MPSAAALAVSSEAATRAAMGAPGTVMSGTAPQRASLPVVCVLYLSPWEVVGGGRFWGALAIKGPSGEVVGAHGSSSEVRAVLGRVDAISGHQW